MALLTQLLALPALLLAALLAGGVPSAPGLALGAAAGLGSGAGVMLLYRGLAVGRMSVVSPVTAVGAATIPAVLGLATGERVSAIALARIALALAAVAMVSASPDGAPGGAPSRDRGRLAGLRQPGLAEAAGAALGFAAFFILLKRASAAGPSLWPLVGTRFGAAALLLIAVLSSGAARRPDRAVTLLLLATAGLDALANVLYLVAARGSLLTLAAVLTSLYPASTVLLARLVLGERMTGLQLTGLAAAAVGVAAIATG